MCVCVWASTERHSLLRLQCKLAEEPRAESKTGLLEGLELVFCIKFAEYLESILNLVSRVYWLADTWSGAVPLGNLMRFTRGTLADWG